MEIRDGIINENAVKFHEIFEVSVFEIFIEIFC